MTPQVIEIARASLWALGRAMLFWSLGSGVLVAGTVAFWPAFRGSSGISQALEQLPSAVVQALGLANFGTPAGYLRANLYDLFVPLLLVAAAVALTNGQTAGDEASGRLELYLAQPIGRRSVFLARATAVLIAMVVITVAVLAVQFGVDAAFDLRIDAGHLSSTVILCGLLGVLHGSLGLAIAGWRARPSWVLAGGLLAAVGGYIVAALFPLSTVLAAWRHVSPWDWAFGGQPLEQATEPWRFLVLLLPAIALAIVGAAAFERRDVRAA